jgi:hypothetical protein
VTTYLTSHSIHLWPGFLSCSTSPQQPWISNHMSTIYSTIPFVNSFKKSVSIPSSNKITSVFFVRNSSFQYGWQVHQKNETPPKPTIEDETRALFLPLLTFVLQHPMYLLNTLTEPSHTYHWLFNVPELDNNPIRLDI